MPRYLTEFIGTGRPGPPEIATGIVAMTAIPRRVRHGLIGTGLAGALTLLVTPGCGSDLPPLDVEPSGELAGAVIATDGGRVPTTRLTLEGESGAPRVARTDAGGIYFFSSVPVGDWTITVEPPLAFELAAEESASKPVSIADGEVAEVDFRLRALGRQ